MNRRDRSRLGDESGFIGAGTAVALAVVAVAVYIVLAAFNSNTAEYGSVSIPGQGTVELPEGGVDVYYAEGVDPSSDIPLIVPADLDYTVSDPDDLSVRIDTRGGQDAEETDGGKALLIGELQAPVEGTYTVRSKSNDVQQRITPALTFGAGPFAAMGKRAESVLNTLLGPIGVLVLLVIVILIFVRRYGDAKQRHRYKDRP